MQECKNIQDIIRKVLDRKDLDPSQARLAMEIIMSGDATDAQIGGFLVGMRSKGETIGEIASFAAVMREKASKVETGGLDVLDTCGTGGDCADTFNISTVSAFVAAGAGVIVAKHGNRSVSSKCGSADVLSSLGIGIDLTPERAGECLRKVGISFMFAPKFHLSMKYAIGPRRELGIRTFFNILGPMTNPAGAKRQLMGVYDRALVEKVAEVLASLGTERAFVVHGHDGLDEITTTSSSTVAEVKNGKVTVSVIQPSDFGIGVAAAEDIKVGSADENAKIFMDILNGEQGPKRDIVLVNSAFAICAGRAAETPLQGFELAKKSIDSGNALKKFLLLKEFTSC